MRVSGSGRSAFVSKEVDGESTVLVSQPSDCLALSRNEKCVKVEKLQAWFGYRFTSRINGPEHLEPPEVWQTALHHLLNTYEPQYCYLHTGGTETGLGDELRVDLEAQGCFQGFWDDKQHVLSLIRWVCVIRGDMHMIFKLLVILQLISVT